MKHTPHIVLTGKGPYPRRELKKRLEDEWGAIVQTAVDERTDLLIADDLSKNTAKLQKARELGIYITTYDAVEVEQRT